MVRAPILTRQLRRAALVGLIMTLGFLGGWALASRGPGGWCGPDSRPLIHVRVRVAPVRYVFSETRGKLTGYRDKLANNFEISHINGLTKSGITVGHGLQFSERRDPTARAACVSVARVDLLMTLSPQVLIAKEYRPGSCPFNEVLAHENKHVAVDQWVVNKHAGEISKTLKSLLARRATIGPIAADSAGNAKRQIAYDVAAAIEDMKRNLEEERRTLQTRIDTREEYEHVYNRCRPSEWQTGDKPS